MFRMLNIINLIARKFGYQIVPLRAFSGVGTFGVPVVVEWKPGTKVQPGTSYTFTVGEAGGFGSGGSGGSGSVR